MKPIFLLSLVLIVVLSGCGVRPEATSRSIEPKDVPYDLLEESPGNSGMSQAQVDAQNTVISVYFVQDAKLVGRPRQMPAPVTPGAVLGSLVQGPFASEKSQGISSKLNNDVSVSATVVGTEARIELGGSLPANNSDKRLLIGQIVMSVTEIPEIQTVTILSSGAVVAVESDKGRKTASSLTRDDVKTLL